MIDFEYTALEFWDVFDMSDDVPIDVGINPNSCAGRGPNCHIHVYTICDLIAHVDGIAIRALIDGIWLTHQIREKLHAIHSAAHMRTS